jgi:hypothetical protein
LKIAEVEMAEFDGEKEQSMAGPRAGWSPRHRALAAIALSSFLGIVAVPTVAQAQLFGLWGWSMRPGQVERVIQSQGFRLTGPLYRNGRVYVADVLDERGVHQRLIVDAYTGDVLQAFVTGPRQSDYDNERSARAEPPDHGVGAAPDGQPVKPKSKSRTAVSKREILKSRPAPARELPPPSAVTAPAESVPAEPMKTEPAKSEPATAESKTEPAKSEPDKSDTAKAEPVVPAEPSRTPTGKSGIATEMPVTPLDENAGSKRPPHSPTDVPVAPLD